MEEIGVGWHRFAHAIAHVKPEIVDWQILQEWLRRSRFTAEDGIGIPRLLEAGSDVRE